MKNFILVSVLMSLIFSSSLFAKTVPYFKGQKEYLKKCRSCHQGSRYFVNQYTIECWENIMINSGEKLVSLHSEIKAKDKEELQGIEEIQEYFKGDRYEKRFKYIKAFVLRFAKDGDKNPNNTEDKKRCP